MSRPAFSSNFAGSDGANHRTIGALILKFRFIEDANFAIIDGGGLREPAPELLEAPSNLISSNLSLVALTKEVVLSKYVTVSGEVSGEFVVGNAVSRSLGSTLSAPLEGGDFLIVAGAFETSLSSSIQARIGIELALSELLPHPPAARVIASARG